MTVTDSQSGDDEFCPDCEDGIQWNNADPTSGQWVECDTCHGTGIIEGN